MDIDSAVAELVLMKRELRRLKFQVDESTRRVVVILERVIDKLEKRIAKMKIGGTVKQIAERLEKRVSEMERHGKT